MSGGDFAGAGFESPAMVKRRRRTVATVSAVGAGMLGFSLSREPGSKLFYSSTVALALTWTVGGLASGPLHLGRTDDRPPRRPVAAPALTGVASFGVFYGAALMVRRIPVLNRALANVLRYADDGTTPLVAGVTAANGVAEEIFFRGALYAALGDHHPVAASTAAYTLATVPTRNPALVLAAGLMGAVWALQRRESKGILAPAITHVTWSLLMLWFMPPLFRHPREVEPVDTVGDRP